MILVKTPDGTATTARLTTDHASSSYGRPVLVLEDGSALGPADVDVFGYTIVSATDPEKIKLEACGYRIGERS
jgi:hypothetical protein